MRTFKLTIEYDGTAYAGWQRQPNQPTVQAALEDAVQRICQAQVRVIGAGRTDAGVHALGQVASFRCERDLSPNEWQRAFNGLLPDDICVRTVEAAPDDFHARYDARGKLYEYRIFNRPVPPALDRHRVWHLRHPLFIEPMREAAALLRGRHDFSSFQGSPTETKNPVCTLRRLEVIPSFPLPSQEGEDTGEGVPLDSCRIRIEAEADRFLRQMVRAIVGTLVEVGLEKRPPKSLKDILAAKDRRAAGYTAPPHGLYLVRVEY